MITAGIIGATGYVGQELVRLLLQHKDIEKIVITSKSYAGKPYDDIYKSFKMITKITCKNLNINQLAEDVDVLFLALPHGLSMSLITNELLQKVKVIDLGADFRIKNKSEYETWYNLAHENADLLKSATYGLPEWHKDSIKNSQLIANPGCYTTCSILALAPLVKEKIIDLNNIIIDAKSGVSGAGKNLSQGIHFNECNETIKAYKVGEHRHTPEIEEQLSIIGEESMKLTFTPHLVPMQRGILVTAYTKLLKPVSDEEVETIYKKHYEGQPFVRIKGQGDYPECRWTRNSNFCDIGFKIDKRTNRLVVMGSLDNLIKGAAGQAIQNMNLMFSFKEVEGINMIPICI